MRLRKPWSAFLAAVALAGLAWLVAPAAPAAAIEPPVFNGVALLAVDQTFNEQIGGATKGFMRELRRYWRTLGWMANKTFARWGTWIRRSAFSIGVAVFASLADSGLLNAWRTEGGRVLTTYVPLMLYVYGRLLFSGGVSLLPKLLLLGAVVYGVVREDFLPDRRLWRGRIDDVVFIVVAARLFVYACPEALVDAYAARAVRWRQRLSAQRAR